MMRNLKLINYTLCILMYNLISLTNNNYTAFNRVQIVIFS